MNKKVGILVGSYFIIVSFFCQNIQNIVDKIKKAKDNKDRYLYEEAIFNLLKRKYAEWVAVIIKLKNDEELRYRKECQKLLRILGKKMYLDKVFPDDIRKKYNKELLALMIYVKKKNLQILTHINNKLSDSKNPFYMWERILYEIKMELNKGRRISDKFVVEIILLLVERYYLVDNIKWIRELIYYDDIGIRKKALDIIAKFSYDEAIEEVTTCLLDNVAEIRSYALEVLGTLFAVDKKLYILKALEDENPHVRRSAIQTARKLGIKDAHSLEKVVRYLQDEDVGVVIEVLNTIRYLNLVKYADEVFDLIKNREIPDSITQPEEFNSTVRLLNEAIITLTYLNYKNPLFKKFLFEKIIASNEPQLIKFALRTIGYLKFGSKNTIPTLLKIFDNHPDDREIQASALYALGYLKQKDVIKKYIAKKIGVMEYDEIESLYEIAKNIYSPQLINMLFRKYQQKDTDDEVKLYLKKIQIIQILTQFTFSKNVKNVILKLLDEESDVRLINLMAEGLSKFKLENTDYALVYKVYEKDLIDTEGYLPICRRNLAKLISKIPKYFNEIFKDYDETEIISEHKLSYLEALEQNTEYLNNESKKRVIDLIYNSKTIDGYDHSPQIFRAVCTIIYLGIDKFIDNNIRNEMIKLIDKFEGNSKYTSAVLASKLLLLLKGDKNFLDIIPEVQDIKGFCQISEYLNLINKKEFLDDFRKIKFKSQILNGPLYLVLNTLNKKIEGKFAYSLNYFNLPSEILNKYILIKVNKGDNLFTLLQYIKDSFGDFTYLIHGNTIVLYTIEQLTRQWLSWYYKNYKKV